MASKLELRFKQIGTVGATLSTGTSAGGVFQFKDIRLQGYEVGLNHPKEDAPLSVEYSASKFLMAYDADENPFGLVTTNIYNTNVDENGFDLPEGQYHAIVALEHPDNTYFDGAVASHPDFILVSSTTTEQESEADLIVTLLEASDPCGKIKVTISSNKLGKRTLVEYPLGAVVADYIDDGTAYEIELARPFSDTSGVVKLFDNPSDTTPLSISYFKNPAVLSITEVTVIGSPFGAATAIIKSTSGTQFSLNNIDFSGSNSFGGLLSGSFTAYVRDDFGCLKSRVFVITEDQVSGLTVPENILVPLHNSLHFTNRKYNNHLNRISSEVDTYTPISAVHNYLVGDVPRVQFKSSYKNHTIKIYGCGIEEELELIQKSNLINSINIYEGNHTDVDGRLAVYFTSGNIYDINEVPKEEGHTLNGFLPHWYKPGVFLKIEGVGEARIERIFYDDNNDAFAVTNLDSVGTVTNKKITSIHSEKNYEIFEFDVNLDKAVGDYIVEIDYGGGKFWSEIIRVHNSLSKYYHRVSWRNPDLNDQINYSTGISPFRRVKYTKPLTYIGQNERETFQSDTTIKLINSKSKAVYELDLGSMSMEMAHGLVNGLNHAGEIAIDGAVFICDSSATPNSNGNWYDVQTKLALIGEALESVQVDLAEINSDYINNVRFLKVSDDGFLLV